MHADAVRSGAIWDELLATLRDARALVLADGAPDSPRDRAEGLRYLTRFLRAGLRVCVEHADPDYPTLCRMIDLDMPWGLDAPDCLYLWAPVRGDAAYRLGGHRGSANHLDIQVNYGHYAAGDLSGWGTIASLTGDELVVDADGRFELVLSASPVDGPWLRLDERAGFVQIRQYFADWEREEPASLWIERVDAAWPPPPLDPGAFAARVARLRDWLEKTAGLWDRMSRVLVDAMPPNSVRVVQPTADDPGAGLRGQAYGMGNFHCAADEAVVVAFTPPPCRQWSVSLADFWWQSLDFAVRQSSLNDVQARLDADGVFRGVIAHVDPGVPNWLDAAGHRRGSLAVRFLLAAAAPAVTCTVVPLAGLRDVLPDTTPAVTPAERAATLCARRRAVWRRYR